MNLKLIIAVVNNQLYNMKGVALGMQEQLPFHYLQIVIQMVNLTKHLLLTSGNPLWLTLNPLYQIQRPTAVQTYTTYIHTT